MMSGLIEQLSNHPRLTEAVSIGVGLSLGLAVLIARSIILERVRSRKHRYRVRRLGRRQYVYEERSEEGAFEQLPFWRGILASVGLGEPRMKEATRHIVFRTERLGTKGAIQLPDHESWDKEVPPWAQGRRAEIIERITQFLGPYLNIR